MKPELTLNKQERNHSFHRYSRSYLRDHLSEREIIIQEHLARCLLGKDKWNEWADSFKQYIDDQEINDALIDFSSTEFEFCKFYGYQFPCDTDFSKASFSKAADFRAVTFSGVATFREASFSKAAYFRDTAFSSDAVFSSCIFSGDVYFSNGVFSGGGFFSNAVFSGDGFFIEAGFSDDADFREAVFSSVAYFSNVSFFSVADFSEAVFFKAAYFREAVFSSTAFFSNVKFSGPAVFIEAGFSGDADFRQAHFLDAALFNSTRFKILILEKTKFVNAAPDFRYSIMYSIPYLSNITLSKKIKHKPNDDLRYRKLKEMSISSHDHQKELEFFALEMRADRTEKFNALNNSDGEMINDGLKILINKLFDISSDYGQSILRPLMLLVIVFFGTYLINQTIIQPNNTQCAVGSPAFSNNYAIALFTASNSLPIIPGTIAERKEIRECLFTSNTPPAMVKIIGIVQFLLSTISLLLIGLGIRNRFKIN